MTGQVHALLLDNGAVTSGDDVYVKHYRVTSEPEAGIRVAPLVTAFDNVYVGGTKVEGLTISNVGDADLTIEDLVITDGSPKFSITSAPQLPAVISPSESVQVNVQFVPSSGRGATGALEILSNDLDEPAISVDLTGDGVTIEEQAAALVTGFDEGIAAGDLEGSGPGRSAAVCTGGDPGSPRSGMTPPRPTGRRPGPQGPAALRPRSR